MSSMLLLVLCTSLMFCSHVSASVSVPDLVVARNVCDLIWKEETKYINSLKLSDIDDVPFTPNASAKQDAYMALVKDACKLNVDDSRQCILCFLGKMGDNATEQELYEREKKCSQRYTIPQSYSTALHFLDGTNDTYPIVFSQLFGACMNNMAQFLRGFSTLGFQFGMNNTHISQAVLGKWLSRAYSLIGYMNEQISTMPSGSQGFVFLKKACTIVHDTEILEKAYLALMMNNTVNQEIGKKNCVTIYNALGRGQMTS